MGGVDGQGSLVAQLIRAWVVGSIPIVVMYVIICKHSLYSKTLRIKASDN